MSRLTVRWGRAAGWDGNGDGIWRGFPKRTFLCEGNLEAVLMFLGRGSGYDVVEVGVGGV